MRILITGAKGRLGGALVKRLTDQHEVVGIDIDELDITDWPAARAYITYLRPDVVLHPAAWTDVDGCARDPEQAVRANGFGAGHVAQAAADVNAAVIYVSTNEVFDGESSAPYREYDPQRPINAYGYSKWVGEQMVARHNPRHMIVRTAWLFAHGGRNFIQAILNAANAGKPLKVVTDEVANPTYTDDLADAIIKLMGSGRYGTYHLVNEGYCSRYEFARYILDQTGHVGTPITAITSADWQRASTPPRFSPLANAAASLVGVTLRSWQDAVSAFIEAEGLNVSAAPSSSGAAQP